MQLYAISAEDAKSLEYRGGARFSTLGYLVRKTLLQFF
jgi:hypothetical protein